MHSTDSIFSFGVASGQIGWSPETGNLMLLAFLGLALTFAAIIVLLVFRKIWSSRKPGDTMGLDIDFIDRVQGKGRLSPDEIKRVREAMVRRAVEGRRNTQGATLKELQAQLLAAALEPPAPSTPPRPTVQAQSEPAKEVPPPSSAPLSPGARRSFASRVAQPPAPTEEASESEPVEGTTPVNMKALLERGLITREDYDRLTSLARELKKDKPPAGNAP
ncbi:hypothetical protein JW916_06325 [Candidatus Sumerlaeota bacterium]|nr:hypothetical protein [Candidatus Sumerlaeota bacterium]